MVAFLTLVFAAPAAAGGPSLVVGVAEDSPKQATLTAAKVENLKKFFPAEFREKPVLVAGAK